VPVYGRAMMHISADGAVQDASARFDLGAGTIRFREELGGRQETVLLDEASLRLRWDIPNKAIVVEPSPFYFGNTRGLVTGTITADGAAESGRYAFSFELPGTVMAPSDSRAPPMVAQRIALSGTADLRERSLTFDNAVIVTSDGTVAAAGSLSLDDPNKTPSLALAASFSPMKVSTLKTIWIPFIAPGARRWVMEHMDSGQLLQGRFEASVPQGVLWGKPVQLTDKQMHLDMQLEDVTFTTIGAVPAIRQAAGNVVMSGSTFGVDVTSGVVETPSGTANVQAAAFAIPDLAKRPADGVVEFQLAGPAAALAQIADADPLHALAQRNLTPDDLSGAGDASVSIRFPLRDQIDEADVDWKVVVNAKDAASKAPVEGRTLSDANLTLTVTPDDVTVYGKARIDGVLADVSMALPVTGAPATKPGERQVRLVLDDDARKRLGVGLEDVLSGTVTALVTDNAAGAQHYELDLRRARVVLPGLGWSKGIGVPATLSFDMKQDDEGKSVDNLVLKGDGFGFTGSARLDSSSNLISADIENLMLRKGDSIAIRLTRGKSGYAISARGSSFDLRGLIAQVRDRNEQAGGFPDVAVDAKIDRLVGYNQEVITNAALNLVSIGGETQKISFSGNMSGSDISLDYAIGTNGTRLNGSADDGGRLLRFVDIYGRIAGGKVSLQGQGGRTGPMVGAMEIDDFDVIDEPAMARVGVGKNAPGGGADGFDPGRVHFDRMVARFNKTSRALVIEEALLRGAAIGATFSGRYDVPSASISITGTYLPAYALNNLFSRLPVIGVLAGGGTREGLIGVTFKIEGPIAEPRVFFNPLSAVAPGIFRKIFEFAPVPGTVAAPVAPGQ
jgi:hypothetical protein